jgi:hypothetical protein
VEHEREGNASDIGKVGQYGAVMLLLLLLLMLLHDWGSRFSWKNRVQI